MPAVPVDTSLTGYTSGSFDKQDDIYRRQQRPQPHQFGYNNSSYDSAYDSATHLRFGSLRDSSSSSLLGIADSVKCNELLNNDSNFALKTAVECYQSDSRSIKRQSLDETGFHDCLSSIKSAGQDESSNRVLLFFTTLDFAEDATYKARSSFSKAAVEALLYGCSLNARFVTNLLGMPNYWSPELYSHCDSEGALASIAPEPEETVTAFKSILNLASHDDPEHDRALLQHPLEAHVILSKILCESSQGYINLFRQSMFAQLRAVDELSVQENTASRKGLANVTIELQIISKDVNKLISDVDVTSRNLTKTQEALAHFGQHYFNAPSAIAPNVPFFSSSVNDIVQKQLVDTLEYLHSSMDKQKMWLHNYRDRKDIAMSLVFNLVTQQDAANNFSITKAMKRDSSSMNGIALLTMVFLPGTFTSSLLGAGLFSAFAENRQIHVSGLWWFWAAITLPLTALVLLLWGVLCWRTEFKAQWARMVVRKKASSFDNVEAKG